MEKGEARTYIRTNLLLRAASFSLQPQNVPARLPHLDVMRQPQPPQCFRPFRRRPSGRVLYFRRCVRPNLERLAVVCFQRIKSNRYTVSTTVQAGRTKPAGCQRGATSQTSVYVEHIGSRCVRQPSLSIHTATFLIFTGFQRQYIHTSIREEDNGRQAGARHQTRHTRQKRSEYKWIHRLQR